MGVKQIWRKERERKKVRRKTKLKRIESWGKGRGRKLDKKEEGGGGTKAEKRKMMRGGEERKEGRAKSRSRRRKITERWGEMGFEEGGGGKEGDQGQKEKRN